jgi:hypothetical protein
MSKSLSVAIVSRDFGNFKIYHITVPGFAETQKASGSSSESDTIRS